MTSPPLHRHDLHRQRVALQQHVHETRRLLLEAADRLLDLDAAARGEDLDQAAAWHDQAAALLAASEHHLQSLATHLPREHAAPPQPPAPAADHGHRVSERESRLAGDRVAV